MNRQPLFYGSRARTRLVGWLAIAGLLLLAVPSAAEAAPSHDAAGWQQAFAVWREPLGAGRVRVHVLGVTRWIGDSGAVRSSVLSGSKSCPRERLDDESCQVRSKSKQVPHEAINFDPTLASVRLDWGRYDVTWTSKGDPELVPTDDIRYEVVPVPRFFGWAGVMWIQESVAKGRVGETQLRSSDLSEAHATQGGFALIDAW